uniref:Uncharacterized protein n=1 Tax=Rhizophora mucronata TaxID=61149 RepID=A0A2P2QR01_RHIMU
MQLWLISHLLKGNSEMERFSKAGRI